jgi:phage-related protein
MSIKLSLAATLEKYKLATQHPWYMLLEVYPDKDDPNTVLRLVNDTEDYTYNGNVYSAFQFDIEPMDENTSGELPSINLRVSNVNRIVGSYLVQYEGGIGATVKLMVVPDVQPTGEEELTATFEILEASASEQWCEFTLGGENPLRLPFPKNVYIANHCRHIYNSPGMQAALDPRGMLCGYNGNLTSCDKTLDGPNGCRVHNNSARFGGFVGIEQVGFRSAQIT